MDSAVYRVFGQETPHGLCRRCREITNITSREKSHDTTAADTYAQRLSVFDLLANVHHLTGIAARNRYGIVSTTFSGGQTIAGRQIRLPAARTVAHCVVNVDVLTKTIYLCVSKRFYVRFELGRKNWRWAKIRRSCISSYECKMHLIERICMSHTNWSVFASSCSILS